MAYKNIPQILTYCNFENIPQKWKLLTKDYMARRNWNGRKVHCFVVRMKLSNICSIFESNWTNSLALNLIMPNSLASWSYCV